MQSLKDGPAFNQTTNIKDSSGNSVKVPGGFKVSSDSANNVSDGVVIEDSNGSQYVWIPVYAASNLNRNMSYPVRGNTYAVEAISGSYDVSDWNRTGWSFITAEYIANIGGFYVGRYETGNSNGKLVVKKNLDPHIPASMNKALERAAEVYSSDYARTNLITSGTWDRVMSFVNGKTSAAGTRYNVSSNITRTDRMNNIKLGAWAMTLYVTFLDLEDV